MDHFDLPAEIAHGLVEMLRDAASSLDGTNRPAFGQEIDLPPVALPAAFLSRLDAAEAALERGDFARVLTEGRALVGELRDTLASDVEADGFSASAADSLPSLPSLSDADIELQKLLLPRLLGWLQRRHPWLHVVATLALLADDKVQEWYPQGFVDRWWDGVIVRAYKAWKQQGEADPGHAGDYAITAAIDALAPLMMWRKLGQVGRTPGGHEGLHLREKSMDWWMGYGHEPAGTDTSTAEDVAARSLTLWWEQPEAEYDVNASAAERDAHYATTPPAAGPARRVAITLAPMREEHGGPFIVPLPHTEFGGSLEVADGWQLELAAAEQSGFATGQGSLKLAYTRDKPLVDVGTDKDLGLTVARGEIAAKAEYEFGAFKDRTLADVVLRLKGVKLKLGSLGTNPILARLLPEKLNNTFDLGLGLNSKTGFYWEGGTGTEAFVPVQSEEDKAEPAAFGIAAAASTPIAFKVPHLRLSMATQTGADGRRLTLDAGLALKLQLGPVALTAEGLGAQIELAWRSAGDGNLGPLHADLRPTLPDRFGLVIDAERVSGGGFLAHDEAAKRWIGALSLQFNGRALDGVLLSEAGSLLGIVWARGLAIPLLGGQLDGLGALLGSDRRADRDAFVAGLADGVLDSVLFPTDPVAQAPQLLATLARLFPREPGRTVIGLMARWVFGGAARLVVADLGLLVELAGTRLATVSLLGRAALRIRRLPEHLFAINVDLFGQLDFDADEFFVKATLRDSKLVGGTLSGGGLLYYSKAQGFIASLGGFNPRYPAPARLGTIDRLTLKIADSDRLKIGFEAYQALTSTSFQMGGKLSLWAGAHGFAVEGLLSLDLLARFDMSFYVDVAAMMAIKRGSRVLAGIDLAATLSGISPWRLVGRAKFKLLFFKVTIPVDFSFGGGEQPAFEPVDAKAPLLAALADPANWAADGAPRGLKLVERRRDGVWIEPRQALGVRQAAVPLAQTITRLGASPLAAPQRFTIDGVALGGVALPAQELQTLHENFAGGLFQDLDLHEAVRAPQFEAMAAGVQLASGQATAGGAVDDGGRYDQVVVDDAFDGAAMAAFDAAVSGENPPAEDDFYAPAAAAVRLMPPRFAVTDGSGQMAAFAAAPPEGLSYAEARTLRRQAWQQGIRCQVVRRYEVDPPRSAFGASPQGGQRQRPGGAGSAAFAGSSLAPMED